MEHVRKYRDALIYRGGDGWYVFFRFFKDVQPRMHRRTDGSEETMMIALQEFVDGILLMSEHCHWTVTFLTYDEFDGEGGQIAPCTDSSAVIAYQEAQRVTNGHIPDAAASHREKLVALE